jgi:hypothetical protein
MVIQTLNGCGMAPVAPPSRSEKARRYHVTASTPNVSDYGVKICPYIPNVLSSKKYGYLPVKYSLAPSYGTFIGVLAVGRCSFLEGRHQHLQLRSPAPYVIPSEKLHATARFSSHRKCNPNLFLLHLQHHAATTPCEDAPLHVFRVLDWVSARLPLASR